MRKRVWFLLIAVVIVGLGTLGLQISNSRSFQFFGGLTHRVKTEERVVALTFDDGPTDLTHEIIEILDRLDVPATFFVIGAELEENKEAGRVLVAAGHELGNHSYSHRRMILKSPSFIRDELEVTDQLIREVGYQGNIHFRPPNAKKLLTLPYIQRQRDTQTIMWDIEPESNGQVAGDAGRIVERTVERVQPGSIILLHVMYESRRQSIDAIDGIVKELQSHGYSFLTVSQLLEYQGK